MENTLCKCINWLLLLFIRKTKNKGNNISMRHVYINKIFLLMVTEQTVIISCRIFIHETYIDKLSNIKVFSFISSQTNSDKPLLLHQITPQLMVIILTAQQKTSTHANQHKMLNKHSREMNVGVGFKERLINLEM